MAGFSLTFANDVDKRAAATHGMFLSAAAESSGRSHHSSAFVTKDLSDNYSHLDRSPNGLVVGGPPCQGFSRAGRMDPDDPRSRHVSLFMNAVEAVHPAGFVLENVAALATNPKWRPLLDSVMVRAERLGFVVNLRVFDAADAGVPQHRQRMFLLGTRDKTMSSHLADQIDDHQHVSVRQALESGVAFADQPSWMHSCAKIVPAQTPVIRQSPFAGMLFNGQGRPLDLESPAPTISASLGGNHTPIVDQLWLEEQRASNAATGYHSAVLNGEHPRVPDQWRRLTVYEAARLQSFPTNVEWTVPKSVAFRQVGNAVPPLLALRVAKIMARSLGVAPVHSDLAALGMTYNAGLKSRFAA